MVNYLRQGLEGSNRDRITLFHDVTLNTEVLDFALEQLIIRRRDIFDP
jgi:hypothetical protein